MLSIRNLARSAPRTLGRLTSASLRQQARPSALIKPSTLSALRPAAASAFFSPFSTTSAARRSAVAESELDDELSAKLESEIQIEEDIRANEQQPASINDFLDNTPYELIDNAGQEVVKLTRSFGDEKITISFSIADITNFDPYNEDPALEDEDLHDDESLTSKHQQSSSSKHQQEDMEDDVDEDLSDEEPSPPINLSIVIEKPGKTSGALNIDATAQDGAIVVDNMFYYADAQVARMDSPEAAQKRADVYPGPPFGSLDDDLQVLMERFLEERGIGQAMAVFVPDYVDVKEQREYVSWLKNVKEFVDA